jgi:exosortase family protein XrtF
MKGILNNPFIKFLALFVILLIAWLSLYKNIYNIESSSTNESPGIERELSILLGSHANIFSAFLGYTPELILTDSTIVVTRITDIETSHGTWIGEPCNGLKVMGLFAIFILAFQGSWKDKLWYIPTGVILIHLANAIRVSALTIIEATHPEYLDFNHNVTFQVLIYGIIFGMWYLWVARFSKLKPALS